MAPHPAAPALIGAYRRTGYEAAGIVVRVGRRAPAGDRLLAALGVRAGGFVTAWNPLSRPMPVGWNRRTQDRLARHARRLPMVAGCGSDRRWREEHLLIGGDPRRLIVLARRFRQRGVVLVAPGRPARLLLLG